MARKDPLSPVQRIDLFATLRKLLHERFLIGGTRKDLDDAIDAARELLQLLFPESRQQTVQLKSWRHLKKPLVQVQLYNDEQNVHPAFKLTEQVLNLPIERDPWWAKIASDLCYGLSEHVSDPKDLDEAIALVRRILAVALPTVMEHNTAYVNMNVTPQCSEEGNTADKDGVTRHLPDQTAPGSPVYAIPELGMANLLVRRFEETGFWRDIEEAIRLQHLILDGMASRDENRPRVLVNLASTMEMKYGRSQEVADLKEAIALYRRSVIETPKSQALTSGQTDAFHHYLANMKKFGRITTSLAILDETLQEAMKLAILIPPSYSQEHINTWLLGNLLSRRYKLSSQPDDLYHVVLTALSCGSLKKQPTGYGDDMRVLIDLISHIEGVLLAPPDNYIMHQVSKAMHREYCTLITSGMEDFILALVALEKEVTINVEVVAVH
jgi:tetratricopeptide (TPR) repeat protein